MKLRRYATRVQLQNGKERGKKRMLSIQKNDSWMRGQTYRNWWWKILGTRNTQRTTTTTTRNRKRRGNTFYMPTRNICLFLSQHFCLPSVLSLLLSSKQNIIFCYTQRKTAGKITNYYIHSTRTQTNGRSRANHRVTCTHGGPD